MTDEKLNVVFMGTPEIALPTLQALKENKNVNLMKVVSMPDRPKGRGKKIQSPHVIVWAKENDIDTFQTANINQELEVLKKLGKIDIILVFAFAQFLKQSVLDLPQIGCFNLHTSLLPKYRGAAPIQYALLNGDKITGVSLQKMVIKMDAGDIVAIQEIAIEKTDHAQSLHDKLAQAAAIVTNEFIQHASDGCLEYIEQDEANVTFAPTIKKEEGFLDFKTQTFQQISNRVRAFKPWPGTFCLLNDKVLKVIQLELSDTHPGPGKVNTQSGKLIVGCQDRGVRLSTVQLPGKKPCRDIDLLNGYKENIEINPEVS